LTEVDDVFHVWGTDLAIGASGDLALASGMVLGQQRVLRRLLTNPGDYIWQPDYGAGLARFVGSPANKTQIMAVIRSQIFKESTVARTPEPIIVVQVSPAGSIGTVYVQIQYADSSSGQTQILSFSVNG
jgi:phage baseplate assembly protein W